MMRLALQLTWQHRVRWLAMLLLAAASAAVLVLGFHSAIGWELATQLQGNEEVASPKLDVIISVVATFLIVRSIAALCLESQARDLAIIKTCGASTAALRRTLLLEIVAVTSLGFVLGVALALPLLNAYVHGAVWAMAEVAIPPIGLDVGALLSAYALLLIAIVLGAYNTLRQVSQQNVVEALRGEASIGSPQRSNVLRALVALLSAAGMASMVFINYHIDKIIELFAKTDAPSSMVLQLKGAPVFTSCFFCLLALIFFTTIAPQVYQLILRGITRWLPRRSPAPLQVGLQLARYNAAKYAGSITPIVVFITVVVMIFTVMDASAQTLLSQLQAAGVDTESLTKTNYSGIAYSIGPAIVIAIIGSLCTTAMSGRNRIYVNKLTGILGARPGHRFRQGLSEMGGYVLLASLVSGLIMLGAAWLVQIGLSRVAGTAQPFLPSWSWWAAAIAISYLFMLAPVIYAQYSARRLASKAVLETFGE